MMTLFLFTIRQILFDRKVVLTGMFLAMPCVLLLTVRFLSEEGRNESWEQYHIVAQFLLLAGVVPLVCLLYGPFLVGAESERGTLQYLLTRRLHRHTVLLIRFLATGVVLSLMVAATMAACNVMAYTGLVDVGSPVAAWSQLRDLIPYLWLTPIAVVAFLALFTLISLTLPKPLVVCGVYVVAFEITLSNLPIPARSYTISHSIRKTITVFLPEVVEVYPLPPPLATDLYLTGQTGVPALAILSVAALGLAALYVSYRELSPGQVAQV